MCSQAVIRTAVLAAAVLALTGCPRIVAEKGPDLLDPSFATDGSTTTPFGCADYSYPSAAIEVGDGGLLAGGKGCKGWALVQYTRQGGLDPSWGDGGTVFVFPDAGDFFEVRSLVARPDGAVIARAAANTRDYVRQFSAAGTVDPAFATAIDQSLQGRATFVQAVALQADGRLLVASGDVVVRVSIDGTLDPTFGTGGAANPALFGLNTFVTRLLVRPDGKLVLTGMDSTGGLPGVPFLAQLSATGALDSSFGTNGVVTIKPRAAETLWLPEAALQPDGKVILAGSIKRTKTIAGLLRLTATGEMDSSFGVDGRVEGPTADGATEFTAVSVLPSGKLVAVGRSQGASLRDSWQAARFTPAGALDTTFGAGGSFVFDVGVPSSPGGATSLVVTAEGYVIAGRAYPAESAPSVFGLARVLP